MQIVVDTNIVISAFFFGGKPKLILDAWQLGTLELILTEEILSEYVNVLHRIYTKYPRVNVSKIITLISSCGHFIEPYRLKKQICIDPDDDKFIEAALGSNSKTIVTGDKHLLDISGFSEIEMIKPGEFISKYL